MLRMEIDRANNNTLSATDQILQRLALLGVPEENCEQLQPGLVAYVKDNKFRISELVSAIVPTNEEVVEAVLEGEAESTNSLMGPSLEVQFHESIYWLQWLMFEREPGAALEHLAKMNFGQHGVCGAVWGNDDIAYRCLTCENDPTCAICVPCFQNGNHTDHDYSIIYTGGGCCDCGDVTAWKRDGFCSKHKGAEQIQPLPKEFADSVGPVLDSLLAYWKRKLLFAETSSQENPEVAELKKVADELTLAVVKMLLEFCKFSESLLSFSSRRICSSVGLLDILVKAERFLSDNVVRKLHELLLRLLSEPLFKYEFAKVFLSYYPAVVNEAIKECNDTIFKNYPLVSTFSVQILTVPALALRLVKEMNLLAMLLECLGNILIYCAGEDGQLQVTRWGNLYETTIRVLEDVRFVMSHSAVPKYVTNDRRDILRTWMRLLASVQGMNPQKRVTGIHIEEENENMHLPFVLDHSIANIHSLLVVGAFSICCAEEANVKTSFNMNKQEFEDKDGSRHTKVGRLSQESTVSSLTGRSTMDCTSKAAEIKTDNFPIPSSVSWLTIECLMAIENWLRADNASTSNTSGNNFFALQRTLSEIRKGRYIFKLRNAPPSDIKLISEVQGTKCSSPAHTGFHSGLDLNSGKIMEQQDTGPAGFDDSVVEGDFANELEAFCVLNLSDWPGITYDVSSQDISVHIPLHRLLSMVLQTALRRCYSELASPTYPLLASYHNFFGRMLGGCHPYGFSAFVMEHPLRIRVFCAEVHAGMWQKNGDAALLSFRLYRSVRWSELGLELDLFLLQCCAALAPADLYVNRILERFGLADYLCLNLEQSSEYEPILMKEMLTLIIQIVKERRFCGLTTAGCLQRELVYKLSIGDATRSQLVKSLPHDLSKTDQLQEILDTISVYSNPSGMNQGMYKMRLEYWKELDLYHPRWNSKDLQLAEERYLRFYNISALTTQLPRWTTIYQPLKGIAQIATCKSVLQIVRAVIFYAVFTEKVNASRAPDGVLLTALHLLSIALDICYVQKESGDRLCHIGDVIPIIAFAGEEIGTSLKNIHSDQSLLSLLVLLMRIHQKGDLGNFMEAGSFNLYSLIENLLKKFAELDSGCMINLQKLAPEIVNQLRQSNSHSDTDVMEPPSDGDKRREKARERQTAMLEKMRAQQSKFLASINSPADDESDSSVIGQACPPDVGLNYEESAQAICSLCHDPNSKDPVSFLILLQKSRLLSIVDRGPPSWELVPRSGKDPVFTSTNVSVSCRRSIVSSSSEMMSPSQLMHLIQNAVNEFASNGNPMEANAFAEFIKTQFPTMRNIHFPCTSNDTREKTASSLETLEERIHMLIRGEMHNTFMRSDCVKNDETVPTAGGDSTSGDAASLLLGKYIAALFKEMLNNPPASASARSRIDKAQLESTMLLPAYDGFGPPDCDGIHLSSCGHAVHQGCLERYLSSLKERNRFNRRIVFEGGHIVDPDKGELLCPVCRGFANSTLPALPEDSKRGCWMPKFTTVSPAGDALSLTSSNGAVDSIRLQEALSLLRCAANVARRNEILEALPLQQNGRIMPHVESMCRKLRGMYLPGEDKISGSGRLSCSMILWDTLKYSIISTEIAARSRRTSLNPNYAIGALYKELNSSSGFILSLLLKVAQSTQAKTSLSVLLRLRSIQLFEQSICSGVSLGEYPSHTCRERGNMLCMLDNTEVEGHHPVTQFWRWASGPVLARDAFSSVMWILFCLPYPFLSCEETFLSLVHIFYAVSVTQAIITYCRKRQCNITEMGYHDCLITDIWRSMGEYGVPQQCFVSNNVDPSGDIKDIIRQLTFPYLRRCMLLWKLINSSTAAPFSGGLHVFDGSSHPTDERMEFANGVAEELAEVKKLEKMFKIPPLDFVINDEVLRSLVSKWFHHLSEELEVRNFQCVFHFTPVVPFKLMLLPRLYQDLLQRYIKQHCPNCGAVQEEPVLCLLCGKLCSPNSKTCCRESGCRDHAMACGAGTGVFLLIRKTTILLQRSARQTLWPSPYLDAFGEEDIEMHRGKPLYLNEERYASLNHMIASHGLDRNSKVV